MARHEFSEKVRNAAWKRCKGRCEKCTARLYPGKFQFDHIRPDGLGGEPTLTNCAVLCSSCHGIKTVTEDRPIMQKADNIRRKQVLPRAKSRFTKHANPWGRSSARSRDINEERG